MLHAKLVFASLGVLGLALACTGSLNDEDGGDAASGTGGTGTSGSSGSGTSGSAGTTSATGGTGGASSGGQSGSTTGGQGGTSAGGQGGTIAGGQGGTTAGGQGGTIAGMGNPTGGTGGTAPGNGGAGPSGGTAGSGAGMGMGGMAPTSGCGAAMWPPGDGATLQTIDVSGTARQYIVQIPAAYDPTHPYRLVFAWHGRTGTAAQIARNFYGLENPLGASTIFVSGQGLGTAADPADTGWPNTNGQDVAFVRALITSLSSSYCIDQNRIMSVGMSYGGIMSYTLGCQMSDVFRAIAPIAGASFGGGRGAMCGTHQVAVWAAHGTADDQVMFTDGESAKNSYVTRNHCQTTTTPLTPSPCPANATDACSCVQYSGCDAGYPVVWCTHSQGHIVPQWSGAGIAAFFQQF